MRYPIVRGGVFWTVQGEGVLLGNPTRFIRLAGCSVQCPECDTDYGIGERLTAAEVGVRLDYLPQTEWVFVTGGEPADYDLWPLLEVCRLRGRISLVTSGAKSLGAAGRLVDFLSVSPHSNPYELKLKTGSQVNLVPGLNGLSLHHWESFCFDGFPVKWVTPLEGSRESLEECLKWIKVHKDFRLGTQAHKTWGIA